MHSKWVPYQNLGISNSERKILSSMGSSARRHGRARPRRPGGARPRRHGGARLGPAPAAHRALELAARRPASAMSPPAQPGGVAAAGPWRRRREKRRGRRGRRRRPALGDDPSPASRRNRRRGGRVAGEWAGRGKKGKEGSSAAPSRRGARRCRRSAASRRRPWLLLPLLQGRRPGPPPSFAPGERNVRWAFLRPASLGTQNGCRVWVACWRTISVGKYTVRDPKWVWVAVCVFCWRQS